MRDPLETLQMSDPRFVSEGIHYLTVKSANLAGRGDISVWLPQDLGDLHELPLVILLHGVYGSHWAWTMNGGAHRTAARSISEGAIRPMALVMPSDGLWGDGSAYCKHPNGDYERWIAEDVPFAARQLLPHHLRDVSSLFISGLSMGGFGALRIGAKYGRDLFAGISGHSSITHFDQMAMFVEEPLESYGIAEEDRSVLETVLRNRMMLPPLRFDCGTSDQLIEFNRELYAGLDTAGIDHVYEEFSGGHEWVYWENHLEDSLRFFDGCLRDG